MYISVYYVQDLIEELMEFNLRTGSVTLQKDVHCTRTILVSTDQVRGNDHAYDDHRFFEKNNSEHKHIMNSYYEAVSFSN